MKIGAIIQARMGSTRLPEKVMKNLQGKTVLEHVIERVKQSKLIDEIIIATTTHERDAVIESEALRCGVKAFRGSEDDVLSRYYYAAKENKLDVVIRITSDCPLIDPGVLDEIINYYMKNKFDIVSNAGSDLLSRTYPRGLDTEIFSFEVLENAFNNAKEKYQREHVTPYIYEMTRHVFYYKNSVDYSKYRWTLDTDEDLKLITEIYRKLYRGKHNFYLSDVVGLFEKYPELNNINAHVEQKKIK
ncbi:glycosyltransferase family protein [Globicatella sulfidifaciens]|uniref:NTP transferase domain-containing protein n=1 Tax=Globicatella sulfidifaciens TaxID=136093 RepID=A0A7X8C2I8_9LACT|nr:glycosyltransferase family protein [Globicatella sulfidifaciens]NLJ17763.1 NTP transferase domain-containing protein [Globicatella sulfidifaciens]